MKSFIRTKLVKKKQKKPKIIPLKNGSYIRRRLEQAVLRYYLNYANDEDLARGLLILFKPFRNELEEIHQHDVEDLLFKNRDLIEEKREMFEKYKLMSDVVKNIESQTEGNNEEHNSENECESEEIETTSAAEIEEFNKWAKNEAMKDLSDFKKVLELCDIKKLRENISSLNLQQRKLFDDIMERMISTDVNEKPIYLFLSGNAGTGKSYLVRLMIEAIKIISIKAGAELNKPSVLVMAPTANAAYIVGGKTIDSALCFSPADINRYTQADPAKMSMLKYQY